VLSREQVLKHVGESQRREGADGVEYPVVGRAENDHEGEDRVEGAGAYPTLRTAGPARSD
jgi:hypothetical protein